MDLTGIYQRVYPHVKEYIFFLETYGTFSRIYHKLGHKSDLNKYRRIGIMPSILSDHSLIRLEINSERNYSNIQTHGG